MRVRKVKSEARLGQNETSLSPPTLCVQSIFLRVLLMVSYLTYLTIGMFESKDR